MEGLEGRGEGRKGEELCAMRNGRACSVCMCYNLYKRSTCPLPGGSVGCKFPSFHTILFSSAIHTPTGLDSTFPTPPLTGTEMTTLERGGVGLDELVETTEETNV